MVDVTDKYFRYFIRLLSKRAFLYSEMVNENAVIQSLVKDQLLSYTPNQHPVVFQLGGNDPIKMGKAAKILEDCGYDEVNINCGCPSQKTKDGCFGAILMFEPKLVA